MIVVKIENWPGGDPSKAKTMGCVTIENDKTAGKGYGHYDVKTSDGLSGRVEKFVRAKSIFALVLRALQECGVNSVLSRWEDE